MNQTDSADQFGQLLASLKLAVRLIRLHNHLMPAVLAVTLVNSG